MNLSVYILCIYLPIYKSISIHIIYIYKYISIYIYNKYTRKMTCNIGMFSSLPLHPISTPRSDLCGEKPSGLLGLLPYRILPMPDVVKEASPSDAAPMADVR